jgi:RimK family alpha-L-glutamate ligase
MKPHYNGVRRNVIVEERRNKKAVLTFGRFNPPTSGHELLINKVLQEARKRSADNFIFASHSQDKKKNPLDSRTKTKHMRTFFKKANIMYNTSIRTIFEALGYLADEGYTDVTVVVGGDRTDEFERTVRPYINHPNPDKSLGLDSFEVVSAGRRDPDAEGIVGMSASKMRAAAAEGDFKSFRQGVPTTGSDRQARKLFDDVRKGMGVVGGTITEEAEVSRDKIKLLVFSGYSEENKDNLMRTAKRIKEEAEKIGVECFVAFVPFARSVKNEDGTRTVINKDGKEFVANRHDTVVIVRGAAQENNATLDMVSAFEKSGFFVINSRDSIEICNDKYRSALTLVEAGLPTPRTALITDPENVMDAHKQVGGKYPVVVKTITGSKGKGVFILESEQSLKSTLDAILKVDDSQELIIQEYLNINGDLRIVVLDGDIIAVMERSKVKGDFRTNFSLGGSIKQVKISDEIKKLALRTAKAVGGYFVGVDIAVTKGSRKPYVIEVNASPGSEGIEKVSSGNVMQTFVKYITDKNNWDYPPTIVGRKEVISVEGIGPIAAKFDTGNTAVNSIHADTMKINGKTISWTHGGKKFKNKIVDEFTILEGGIGAHEEKRYVIELDIEFLDKKYAKRRFTLDDRSKKGTPVLIGVPFMKEFHIVVDPGKKFIKTTKLKEEVLTKQEIKLRDKFAKDLKKRAKGFKDRYGDDYEDVIFGTATNMAKKKAREEEYTDDNLEGTPALTRKRKRMTPGQVNEIADTYFKGDS